MCRTHREIMEEVIAKSKMHKLERQEQKRVWLRILYACLRHTGHAHWGQNTDSMVEKVDEELDAIRGLLAQASHATELKVRF